METEEKIRQLIEKTIVEKGYELFKIKYEKENNNNFLRVIIDKEDFVKVEDCVLINNLISPILDNSDLIKESYILDVCSKEKGRP